MNTVLITGSNSGIGYCCAIDLARKGYKVYAGVREISKGMHLKEEASKEDLQLELIKLDVNSDHSMVSAVSAVIEADHKIDVLINNAGIAKGSPLEYVVESDLRETMETNFFGAFRMMQLVTSGMRERRSGSIINISSINGLFAGPGQSVYCASKFALEAASQSLATELIDFGVRVICIQPGIVVTEMFGKQPPPDSALFSPPFPYHKHVRRLDQIFQKRLRANPAVPQDIAVVVYQAITEDSYRHQYLVGEDAQALANLVATKSPKAISQMATIEIDEEYFHRLRAIGYPIPE